MWSPQVDIKETNSEIIIAADIPGAKRKILMYPLLIIFND